MTAGVVQATSLAGLSWSIGKTGAFIPTATLAGWLTAGSGIVLVEGIVIGNRVVLSERLVLSEGLVLSERVVLSETGQIGVTTSSDSNPLGEP